MNCAITNFSVTYISLGTWKVKGSSVTVQVVADVNLNLLVQKDTNIIVII